MLSRPLALAILLTAVAQPAVAQFTSPAGLDLVEGNSAQTQLFGPIDRRFQQIDDTAIAMGATTISSIAFRRDGNRTSLSSTSRTFDIEVKLGHALAGSARSSVFANNYIMGTETTVVATRTVTLPDWTANMPGPAPADLVIAFDAPFSYNGTDALVWEVVVTNNTGFGTIYTDRQLGDAAFAVAEGVPDTPGCRILGRASDFESFITVFNYGTNHPTLGQRVVVSASEGASSTPFIININQDLPARPVPFLCASINLDQIIAINVGTSSAVGESTDFLIDIPFNPILNGAPLSVQALCIDLTQPSNFLGVALSDIKDVVIPQPTTPLVCSYVYAGPTDTAGQLFPQRGVVVTFQ